MDFVFTGSFGLLTDFTWRGNNKTFDLRPEDQPESASEGGTLEASNQFGAFSSTQNSSRKWILGVNP